MTFQTTTVVDSKTVSVWVLLRRPVTRVEEGKGGKCKGRKGKCERKMKADVDNVESWMEKGRGWLQLEVILDSD